MIEYMRELRGARLTGWAICTNNVREWEQLWRAKLPVDEIFEVVVDSGFVGYRKPEARGSTKSRFERLGVCRPPPHCSSTTSTPNCSGARELGNARSLVPLDGAGDRRIIEGGAAGVGAGRRGPFWAETRI